MITCSVSITEGATLTIAPGTVVKLERYASEGSSHPLIFSIEPGGKLIVAGTGDNPVVFTSVNDDEYGGDLDGNPSTGRSGDWGMIHVEWEEEERYGELELDHALIRYGGYDWPLGSNPLIQVEGKATIRNSILEHGIYGLDLWGREDVPASVVEYTTIRHNAYTGLMVSGGAPMLNTNNIYDNSSYGVFASGVNVTAENHWWGDPSGPYHPTSNPDGLGDRVSDYVDYEPWLTSPAEPTYSISGRVHDANNNPISNVTLSDGAGHTATTDSNGNYTISELSAGIYTLTPSKSDYTFAPASRTVSVPPSATGQDFTGTPTPPPPLDKPPVVLVHGWAGASGEGFRCEQGIWRVTPEVPNTFGTFGEMAKWLDEDGGFDVWIAHLDTGPDGTPRLEANAWGAGCLKDQIAHVKQQTGAQQVILISHSMGGLVSRAYIEGPKYETDVQALFTLGSPHAGIPIDSIIDGLPDWSESYCDDQKAVCQMSEVSMYIWNRVYGSISHGVTPPYYLIGGDKSDSVPGGILKSCGVDPNDGYIGTRSAQALKDGSTAIQSNVKARYQTHETHSSSWVLGRPSYFQPPSGQVHGQSYQCIQNVLLGTSNPCAGLSSATLSAQAASSLTGHTSGVRGHLNTGETAEHTLQVDADGASLFYLSWVTGTLGLTLTNPVGTVIDPAYAAAHTDVVTYTTSSGSEMTPPFASYAFTTTVPGLYTATITAGDVGITGTDYLLFAAMETARTLSVALDNDYYQIGDTVVLTATLEGAGGGITGATVQATFSRSDAITDTLTLTDQGDGTYRGTYDIPNAPGYLHLRVTAEGSDAGTQFNRQVDRLLTVASQAVQLTGTYADRADDADGNGRYETLTVDIEVLAAGAGNFTFSADLVNGADQFVAHVITQTALITGTQSVPLSFDGNLIHDGESDGPFTVTNLLISDPQNAGIPSVMANDVWTTAAYDHTQFGRITGDLDGDCVVTVVDIMLVASRWNTTIGDIRYDAAYDFDKDGDIDIVDIMKVAARWGDSCE